ncbi:M16 family metallopeptidase [Mesorhizobium silamurunense]|uniref:M16 family metallopeptidase n=1 Tax=Mesorhizobium silamurunense TaxID=499528 RepID=UPI001AEED4DB
MIISPKNTAAGLPDQSEDDARARPGNTKTVAHPARHCATIHLLAQEETGTKPLQNEEQITWPQTLPVDPPPQREPSIELRSHWLRRAFIATALVLSATAPVLADKDDGKVTDFLLDNGMEVVVIPDHRAPIVTHMVWYKAGSADEPIGKSGIAHFFEHLMFKATANHAAGELNRAVAEIGGSHNAFTFYDFTAFYQRVAPSALEQMMGFEADRMRNLSLSDDDIKTERDVILEERRWRIDNNPQAVLEEEVDATLWQNHPYRIPIIGWMQEMEQLNRADAIAFYNKYYNPNNAVLVVAGDVEPETVKALAEKTYGKLPRGPELLPRVRPVEPEQSTKRTVTLSDARVSVPSFSTRWVVPSYRTAEHGEAEALDLLAEILGGGNRSRLYQQLVLKQGIATEASASFQGEMLDDAQFTVHGSPRGGASLADLKAAADAEVARIAKDGVTSEELDNAKDRYVRTLIFAQDEQDYLANMYGSTLAIGGTVKDVEEWPDRIRKVTPDQIKAVAARYLVSDHSTAGYLLPKTEN